MNKLIGISLGLLLYKQPNLKIRSKINKELKEDIEKSRYGDDISINSDEDITINSEEDITINSEEDITINSEDDKLIESEEDNSRNFIKRQFEDFIPDYQLVNITTYFNNTTYYDKNIKSSNGFFFDYNDQVYLVSTAHTIIDNWQNVNANIANKIKFDINVIDSEIKQDDLEVTDYHYNRYFDVMVAKVSDVFRKYAWKEVETNKVDKVKVVYLDPLSNNKIEKESEYVNQVNSSIHLGAIHHLLLEGSSGSPILYNDNKLVGMVTSTDEEYKNMSLSIPIKTIQSVIDNYKNNFKYFGFETNLINSNWLNSLSLANRKTLRQNGSLGELVLNTENININPFDIITHVDNQLVGNGGARSINLALENQSNESFQIKGLKINSDFTKKYCTYPRDIFKKKRSARIVTILDVKINKVNKNQLVLDNVEQMLEFTNLKIVNKFTQKYDNYLIKSIDYLNNIVILDRSGDFDTSSECQYFLNTNVYNTNISTDIDRNDLIISTTNYYMLEPFKIENKLNENQYKSLIILALFKNWCFLIFDFIKDKDISLQHYIVLKEFDNLFYDILVDLFNNFNDFYYSYWGDFYTEFVSKANEFLGPNCVNIVKLFTAALVQFKDFDDELMYEFQDVNEKTLPNNLGRYSNSLDDVIKSVVSENVSNFNIDKRKLRKNLLFNDFSVSNFQSEFYDNKSKLSDQSTFKKPSDYKLYAKNLELVYQEIKSVLAADLSGDKLYQIKYYTNIKSYWDHAGYLLSHVLQDPLLDYQPFEETIDLGEEIPEYLDTWQYNSVLQDSRGGGGSWITYYLHQENLLTNQDLETFSNLTFYGLKNHPDFTQAYRSSFQSTMESFKQKASQEEWLDLQSWSKQILKQIKANQLEEAFQGFKNKVLQLTNQYNPDLQFDSIEALDSYFLAKNNH